MEDYLKKSIDHLLDLFGLHLRKMEWPDRDHSPISAPPEPERGGPFGSFCLAHEMSVTERLLLCLALLPEVMPHGLERVIRNNDREGDELPELGGIRGERHRGIIPTGTTAAFLLAGNDLNGQLAVRQLLTGGSRLVQSGILKLAPPIKGEPLLSGLLSVEEEWLGHMLTGRVGEPMFSAEFPAHRLSTNLDWVDLVLGNDIISRLDDLRNYLQHAKEIDGNDGFGRFARSGYRALFYGPPGTGKTLTASLLGKAFDRPVYRIDLSSVVSKYIGETEKNLAGLFARAEHKDWILFFDEAESLFSKRTEVKTSNDRHANQATSFLLQRIENYDGLVILASNLKDNLDDAFSRRFESMISFRRPDATERLRLWQKMVPEKMPVADSVDLAQLAENYELTGGSIANALRQSVFAARSAGETSLSQERLLHAIRLEFEKEGRMLPR